MNRTDLVRCACVVRKGLTIHCGSWGLSCCLLSRAGGNRIRVPNFRRFVDHESRRRFASRMRKKIRNPTSKERERVSKRANFRGSSKDHKCHKISVRRPSRNHGASKKWSFKNFTHTSPVKITNVLIWSTKILTKILIKSVGFSLIIDMSTGNAWLP